MKKKNNIEEDILMCACKNKEHIIKIKYNNILHRAYCDIHLNKLSFIKRLKLAFMYLIGKENTFGEYESFIFNEKHSDALINLGNKLKK